MMTSYSTHFDQSQLDSIHNYYERIVFGEIHKQLHERAVDSNFVADVACIALNNLPPRYVRHAVDTAFYLSPKESIEMETRVAAAVGDAIAFVDQRGSRTSDV